MPNPPFTSLIIFPGVALVRYWEAPITHLVTGEAPNFLFTGSLCSLTVKINWYCSCRRISIRYVWHCKVYGPVLHWTEVTEYPSQLGIFWCCHESSQSPKACKNLGLPSFTVILLHFRVCHCIAFELDIVYHTWTKWRKSAASLDSGKYILSAAIVLGSNIARALATFCLQMPGWRFVALSFSSNELYQRIAW